MITDIKIAEIPVFVNEKIEIILIFFIFIGNLDILRTFSLVMYSYPVSAFPLSYTHRISHRKTRYGRRSFPVQILWRLSPAPWLLPSEYP